MSHGLKIWNSEGVVTLNSDSFATRYLTTFMIYPNGAQSGSIYIPELANAVGTPWVISYMVRANQNQYSPAICTITGTTLNWKCDPAGTSNYANTRVMIGVF